MYYCMQMGNEYLDLVKSSRSVMSKIDMIDVIVPIGSVSGMRIFRKIGQNSFIFLPFHDVLGLFDKISCFFVKVILMSAVCNIKS